MYLADYNSSNDYVKTSIVGRYLYKFIGLQLISSRASSSASELTFDKGTVFLKEPA